MAITQKLKRPSMFNWRAFCFSATTRGFEILKLRSIVFHQLETLRMSALFEAIKKNDFSAYLRLLKTERAADARDSSGGTVLHHLARRTDLGGTAAGIAAFVSSKYDVENWIVELSSDVLELMLVQDSLQKTCTHVALESDNWAFAIAINRRIDYGRYPDRLRRNHMGLTEYELAIVLYGVHGRKDKLNAVFGEIDSIYLQGLGRVPSFRDPADIRDAFAVFKRVAKAVKIVQTRIEGKVVKVEYIASNDERFPHVVEEEYPSALAKLKNEDD